MGEQDKVDKDGIRSDGVRSDQATSHLHIYQDDRQQLGAFQEPVFLHANNPHERLYVAAFDGTGNDKVNDPEHETNIGLISDQIETLNRAGNNRISGGYVEGPGTQHDPLACAIDGARGYTVDERAEFIYRKLIDQVKQWRHEDSDVQVRVAVTGFSRGGEEAALFARLVDERGIQDPSGAKYTFGSHGQIKHVEYTKPPLVAPGQIAQAVALFDPVGTGHAMHEDRRLPPSVISGIQFTSIDEHRALFQSDRIIDPGITPDGRFAGVYVPGAHSDVGGGYHRDGLSIRTGNMAIDYLNGLSDQPFLDKRVEPDDPRLNVIHHSEEGMLLYQLDHKIDRLKPGGYNELEVSKQEIRHVADPYNAEPRNEMLNRQFERQTMPDGPQPVSPKQAKDAPKSDLDKMIDQLYQGALNNSASEMDAAANDYLRTPHGQVWQQQAQQNDQIMQVAQQQAAQQPMAHPSSAMQR